MMRQTGRVSRCPVGAFLLAVSESGPRQQSGHLSTTLRISLPVGSWRCSPHPRSAASAAWFLQRQLPRHQILSPDAAFRLFLHPLRGLL